MNRTLFYPAIMALLLVGCRPEENPGQLNAVNQSLERVNKTINDENNLISQHLLNTQADPQTADIVTKWVQRADRINRNADSVRVMIKELKEELISQSDSLKREYVTVIRQLYDDNGVGNQLLKKLAAFKDSIPVIMYGEGGRDSSVAQGRVSRYLNTLLDSIPLLPGYVDSLSADQRIQYGKKWLNENFGRSSSLMAMIMLNKIENDLLLTQKILIEYCNMKVASSFCGYNVFHVITSLSSSYVKRGQEIEGKIKIEQPAS
ncbi:hypothetical protein A3860_03635 [Niastella vici]|uniref:Gliding motility-associated protein GldM N-terminal domain-containing protein n=1 Tax=Niastella vici TaxID=1703345 RepID=A0A1V9FXV8_9BACT|nr:hypothetical protein [Niastella vici]OQP63076.1 hypothetical protein A3860_03635 [Niastella vici]